MNLLIQIPEGTNTEILRECELGHTIEYIKRTYAGIELPPKQYELFRYKLGKGVIVIYKDNRVLRSLNEVYEYRALAALAKEYGPFKHGVHFQKGRYQTEVDGVSTENDFLVETKRTKIDQKWIDFYQKKARRLGSHQLFLVAPAFEDHLDVPPSLTLMQFTLDWNSIKKYYQEFQFPSWILEKVTSRHIRFLLPNGKWKGAKRSLTRTPKHTIESKFNQALLWLKYWVPAKVYYTMARMVNPPREYFGKGYPLPHLLAVFDIDADSHLHVIGAQGYCQQCISEATEKRELAEEILSNEGYDLKTVFSGKKGFHIYLMEEEEAKEVNPSELLNILEKIKDLTDSASFRDKNGQFDLHRIIKVPNTVDASTAMTVSESIQKLKVDDRLTLI